MPRAVSVSVSLNLVRSWLVSTLWDDDWSCIGGPAGLVGRFVRHRDLQASQVAVGQDATPPGH
jgi:hypothetical protein